MFKTYKTISFFLKVKNLQMRCHSGDASLFSNFWTLNGKNFPREVHHKLFGKLATKRPEWKNCSTNMKPWENVWRIFKWNEKSEEEKSTFKSKTCDLCKFKSWFITVSSLFLAEWFLCSLNTCPNCDKMFQLKQVMSYELFCTKSDAKVKWSHLTQRRRVLNESLEVN